MKREDGDWTRFRNLPNLMEIDFHPHSFVGEFNCFWDKMRYVEEKTESAIIEAYEKGYDYLLVTHGHSTSRPFMTTSRSIVRTVFRSKEITKYVFKKECIQHYSVFVFCIRKKGSDRLDGETISCNYKGTGLASKQFVAHLT
jgi:hypothetical protein